MTLGRSLLWFIVGVLWVCAAFAIVYAHKRLRRNKPGSYEHGQTTKKLS
jgi:hypothetical protein